MYTPLYQDCVLELRRKPLKLRVKTFDDKYEEMSFNVNHTIAKIKEELANKILVWQSKSHSHSKHVEKV
jgi:hypothetical protein